MCLGPSLKDQSKYKFSKWDTPNEPKLKGSFPRFSGYKANPKHQFNQQGDIYLQPNCSRHVNSKKDIKFYTGYNIIFVPKSLNEIFFSSLNFKRFVFCS